VPRSPAGPGRAAADPTIVAVTSGATAELLAGIASSVDPDVIQHHGDPTPDQVAASPRPAWAVISIPSVVPAEAAREALVADAVQRAGALLAAGARRIVLDTAGGPHPGGTGTRADPSLAAAVAREVPVILAAGCRRPRGAGLLAIPASRRRRFGVEPAPPRSAAAKDPLAVALFAKRARAARLDRPNVPSGPTPSIPARRGDARGHWAERDFGGRFGGDAGRGAGAARGGLCRPPP